MLGQPSPTGPALAHRVDSSYRKRDQIAVEDLDEDCRLDPELLVHDHVAEVRDRRRCICGSPRIPRWTSAHDPDPSRSGIGSGLSDYGSLPGVQ